MGAGQAARRPCGENTSRLNMGRKESILIDLNGKEIAMIVTRWIALLAMLGVSAPAGAVELTEEVTSYPVRGNSVSVLMHDLFKKGTPSTADRNGSPASATVSIRLGSRLSADKDGCRIEEIEVRLNIIYVRPILTSSGRNNISSRKLFDMLSNDIRAFQNEQRRIAVSAAQTIERKIAKLPAKYTCSAVRVARKKLLERQIALQDSAQMQLIARWGKGINAKIDRFLRNAK